MVGIYNILFVLEARLVPEVLLIYFHLVFEYQNFYIGLKRLSKVVEDFIVHRMMNDYIKACINIGSITGLDAISRFFLVYSIILSFLYKINCNKNTYVYF
jgi:hypothetical protein